MELIILFLLVLPIIGYILQLASVGKSKETEVLLPVISPEIIRASLIDYTRSHNWSLLVEEPTTERLLYVFRSGQFGFSKEGVQKVTVSFFPSEKEIKCFIKSESLLGQFYDFNVNQKNIESLSFFLAETIKHPDVQERTAFTPTFFPPHQIVNVKYWVFLLCMLLLLIGSRAVYNMSRQKVPGKVIITFHSYISEEIATKMLMEFGAIDCVSLDKIKIKSYECNTPIDSEEKVADTARSNAVVQSAEPKYKN